MTLSKDEAALALEEIGAASARMSRLKGYVAAAPFMILWGVVWLVANSISDLWPRIGGWVWLVCIALGSLGSALLGISRSRRRAGASAPFLGAGSWRHGATFLVIFGFFAALFWIIGPLSGRQGNALISLFWCFAYMLTGIWIGWRIFAVGAATAALTIFGYVALKEHFALWMGLVGGGSLIAGGLWLRRV